MIDERTSLRDVAGAVAAALRNVVSDPIVVGGSAATIHAPQAYRSRDADFVIPGGPRAALENRLVIDAMATIGFRRDGSIFVHERSPFTVDFVPGPIQIANDFIRDFETVPTAFGPLRVLRVVDAVCDRLNKYLAWRDWDALSAAVELAILRQSECDSAEIRAFVERNAPPAMRDEYKRGLRLFLKGIGSPSEADDQGKYGFTSALAVRLAALYSRESTDALITRLSRFARAHSLANDDVVAFDLAMTPEAHMDGDVLRIPIQVRTARRLSILQRIATVVEVSDAIHQSIERFPEIREVIADDAPPVAYVD